MSHCILVAGSAGHGELSTTRVLDRFPLVHIHVLGSIARCRGLVIRNKMLAVCFSNAKVTNSSNSRTDIYPNPRPVERLVQIAGKRGLHLLPIDSVNIVKGGADLGWTVTKSPIDFCTSNSSRAFFS